MAISLPLELVLLVASHVEREKDMDTLKVLSSTASLFRDLLQRAIFSHIVLTTPSSANATKFTPGERLLELLSSNPKLIPLVKRITISDFDNPWASWLPNDLKLAEALDKLDVKKIEGFTLRRNYRASWLLLNHSVRRVIVEICRSPALVDLSLSWAPLALVHACEPSLKNLTAHDCSVGAYAADIAPSRLNAHISLESLKVYHEYGMESVINSLLNPPSQIRVDALRAVHITISEIDDYLHIPMLLERCKSSLEALTLVPSTDLSSADIASSEYTVQLNDFPMLRTLVLDVDATTPSFSGERMCLPWTASMLCSLPRNSNLEVIRLKLTFDLSDVPGGTDGEAGRLSLHELRAFGNLVNQRESFPQLKTVEVEIHSTNPDDDDVDAIKEWVLDALAILPERNVLNLKAYSHPDYGV